MLSGQSVGRRISKRQRSVALEAERPAAGNAGDVFQTRLESGQRFVECWESNDTGVVLSVVNDIVLLQATDKVMVKNVFTDASH